jgi:membrane dipeptidase
MFGMENGSPIQNDMALLHEFYRLGIRYITLSHAYNNQICDSCAPKEKTWHGLSPFGKKVVAEMNQLGIMVDCSHISDESFYDCLKYSKAPFVATHSCCRALSNHPRNMTDKMIKDLAHAGGVIQINFYPAFISKEYADQFWDLADIYEDTQKAYWKSDKKGKKEVAAFRLAEKNILKIKRPTVKDLVDHIDHVVDLVGADHVGLGSDFDGIETTPVGLEDISKMENITKELVARGYTETDVKNILGENLLRVLTRVEDLAYTF